MRKGLLKSEYSLVQYQYLPKLMRVCIPVTPPYNSCYNGRCRIEQLHQVMFSFHHAGSFTLRPKRQAL